MTSPIVVPPRALRTVKALVYSSQDYLSAGTRVLSPGVLSGGRVLSVLGRLSRLAPPTVAVVLLFTTLAPAAFADHTTSSPVRIDAMDVSVIIDHHYALTTVRETLTNPSDEAWEFTATLASPELSFVTRFALETGGAVFESRIEDAAAARARYDASAAAAQTAALIESRDTQTYTVSLNLPASTTVVVHLAYEEMVYRVNGEYRYRFPLVASTAGKTVGTLSVAGSVDGGAVIERAWLSQGRLDWPTPSSLSVAHSSSHLVQDKDLVLTWTEANPAGAGTLITHAGPEGGTFVHVFSAEGAGLSTAPLSKDIVFVLDISGSMSESLPQVKEVFSAIIADLRPADRFSVVAFSGTSWEWSSSLRDATHDNVASALAWVDGLDARSSTNIDLGLRVGVSMLSADAARAPALVLLSDGEATAGETRTDAIRENLRGRNAAGAAVYTLAFGPHADFELMEALALENDGEVRRIWLGQDAGHQIRGFYESISTPLMRGIRVEYTEGVVSASPTDFARAFSGSDLTTVGNLAPGATTVAVTISGFAAGGPVTFSATFSVETAEAGAFVERAWAFERIRQLEGHAALGDATARSEIVSLALTYRFVTDYTSLVVVLPPALGPGAGGDPLPVRMTTSSVLSPSAPAPTGAYAASPPPRAAPGPSALLAALGLAAVAFAVRRQSLKRA